MRRRHLVLLAAVVAVGLLLGGTHGVTGGTLERGVPVNVVADQHATLGVDATDVEVTGDTDGVVLLKLTNRDAAALTSVDVTVQESRPGSPPGLSHVIAVGSLDVGESGRVRADVTCESGESELVALHVVASRPSLEIDLTRQVLIRCP